MAVSIKFTTNTKQVQRNIKRFQNKFPNIIQKGLKQAGFQLLEFIRTKTKKGLRFDSGRFASYSASYLKRLEKEGRPTAVDLIYDNRMMGSLTPEMRQRALFNQVLNKPERPFFGFNDRTEKAIKKSFNRFVEKEIKRHL